ncbi:MAG: tetratricopeptide repeat protein [Pyrinomonadaceae bacterium]|nr:tetratricopeptide repeat protein [Pyrinomonadaceae bacterium]
MRKRTIIAIVIAVALTFSVTSMWEAQTDERDGDTSANVIEANGSPTGKADKKDGNKVARVLSAPFRAIGRLFKRGKDEGKLQHLTEKDVEKFESVGTTRVADAKSVVPVKTTTNGTARDHLALGRAFINTGQINEAITELSLALSLDPKLVEANSLLGIAYDRKGMHDRAKDFYERAVKADKEDAQTLNNLGFSLYLNGNYRAAVDKLKKAAKLAPGDQRILNNLALAQCRLGKYEDAYKSFARAGGEVTGRLNTATMLERAGRNDEAIAYYEAVRRLQPTHSVALRRLADLYSSVGRYDDSKAAQRALSPTAGEIAMFWGN